MTRHLLALVLLAVACSKPPAASSTTTPDAKPTAAVADELPKAEVVLALAVDAAGGKAAHDALGSYYSESRMEIPSQGLAADSRLWWEKDKFYMEVDMPGVGLSRIWCDGTAVISEDPVNGRRTLEGREATQSRWAASVSLAHDWAKFFTTATTVGRRQADGRQLIDVKLVGADDVEVVLSFDEASHLLSSQKFSQQSPMGAMPVEVAVTEYKPYAGLQQAARTEMRIALFTAITTMTKFDANIDIDDSKFVPAAPTAVPPPKVDPVPGVRQSTSVRGAKSRTKASSKADVKPE